ncbi:hypothetical protein AB0E27_11350 [Streptomyces sparsogenes]|uniref:hypothetical protein n=1 Tax=Streptomyces sparsogenes TaxID=67365 RepID=UPI0033EDC49B
MARSEYECSRRRVLQASALAFATAPSPWSTAAGFAPSAGTPDEDGYDLRLRYRPTADPRRLAEYRKALAGLARRGQGPVMGSAESDLRRAARGLTGSCTGRGLPPHPFPSTRVATARTVRRGETAHRTTVLVRNTGTQDREVTARLVTPDGWSDTERTVTVTAGGEREPTVTATPVPTPGFATVEIRLTSGDEEIERGRSVSVVTTGSKLNGLWRIAALVV